MRSSRVWLGLAVVALFAMVGLFGTRAVSAASVVPVIVSGNPDCTDLGYDFGYKPQPEPPPTGSYTFPGTSYEVSITSDGVSFDWESELGVDAVIVKGGNNGSNIYTYATEQFADTNLRAPLNTSGSQAAISHIEFCYDFEVTVTKTASTSFDRTYTWDLDKSVSPDSWELFDGDSGTSEYTVTATRSAPADSNWAVSGQITVANATPFPATITGVTDVVSGAGAATVSCPVSLPYTLAPGQSLVCSYTKALPNANSRTNTATAATTGIVGGDSGTAPVTFGAPSNVYDASLTVDDSNGESWTFDDTGSETYNRTFTCGDDAGEHVNTVSATPEKGPALSDSATVTVSCYELQVSKTATTSFTRSWDWTIAKSADQTDLTLSLGQSFLVNYSVLVSAAKTDSDHTVAGTITIVNEHPSRAASLTSVADSFAGVDADVDCPGLSVPAGGSLVCSYTVEPGGAVNGLNTATATQQNYSYASDGTATPSGTTGYSGTANVTFGGPTSEVDECVDVSDTLKGALGTVCAGDAPKTFTYSYTVGPYTTCGDFTVDNTASFVTNDTGATGSSSWTVNVNVPCAGGCTLTQGYWKTHSQYGPAPYDDTWAQIGENTLFFNSGKTYYQVLWTAPSGNAYYVLAHQYIAAELNVLNGASTTKAVDDAMTAAKTLFSSTTPTTMTRAQRNTALTLATTLDQYNNGLIGPGHCSE